MAAKKFIEGDYIVTPDGDMYIVGTEDLVEGFRSNHTEEEMRQVIAEMEYSRIMRMFLKSFDNLFGPPEK